MAGCLWKGGDSVVSRAVMFAGDKGEAGGVTCAVVAGGGGFRERWWQEAVETGGGGVRGCSGMDSGKRR